MDAVSTTPQGPGRELHLRVGTAQRERALEVIRNAAADERITFAGAVARVKSSRTPPIEECTSMNGGVTQSPETVS